MGPGRMQKGLLQFLPLLGVFCATWTSSVLAQESFPNELNSPVDEPQVIVREHSDKVPVRQASREIQQSTDPLVKLAWETREATRRRLLSTAQHTPWQMMHGLLGLRHDFLISHNGEAINGLEWMRTGPTYQNEPWFQKSPHGGRAHPFNKPYWFEGHINQSLAILSQCEVPLDTTFGTPDGPITMRDMLKNAQMTVNEKEEVTWTLWALCTYLPPDAKWVNEKGEQWSIERLVQVEVGKPVGGPTSPCGGTHGLYALARARNIYLATGKPLRGVWYQADQKIKKYIQISRTNQNANGTLSSAFFKGKEFKQDFDKRMASTGHQLEFLMMALDDRQLREPWVRRAVEATANDLMANRKAFVSCSPLYHATNALTIYLERTVPSQRQQNVALRPSTKTISNSKDVTQTQPPAQGTPVGPGTVPPVPKAGPVGTPAVTASTPGAVPAVPATTAMAQTPAKEPATSPTVVAPALKQVPATVPAPTDGSAASKTATSTETDASKTAVKPETADSSESPLMPVPLPDLTIPNEEEIKTAPATTPDPTSTPSASEAPKATPETTPAPVAETPAPVAETTTPPAEPSTPPSDNKTPEIAPEVVPVPLIPASEGSTVKNDLTTPSPITLPLLPDGPIVSAERPEHAGPSEAVAPMLSPVPLQKVPTAPSEDASKQPESHTEPSKPKVRMKSVSSARTLPIVTVPAAPTVSASSTATTPGEGSPAGSTSVAPAAVAPTPNAGEKPSPEKPAEKAPETPAEKKGTVPTDKQRWKATPSERRKTIAEEGKKTKT